ncbi:chemotaxis protein [Salmonella enterica]|nr:chemotaxis protein [Salmonella enterica]ECG1721407.1 chemotaxis protein [Salmonella enterica subsp. diarizonae serovar 17:z10:e,n,x,z15]EDY2188992.1 chemotaxis protein [Salmonella enterica subsp. enterica]EAA9597199.1 chemotaxis protein [Salmonella enterica]EAO9640394.1 chemotaxis protein [Salmonella enterica]
MVRENTEKLQHIYRLQQGKLVSISNLTENLNKIWESLEVFSDEQKVLAGELEGCANKIRRAIKSLESKESKGKNEDYTEVEDDLVSSVRKKTLRRVLQKVNDTTTSVAEGIYRLSASHKHSAALLDLSVIIVKHFLWRERIFMAIILGGHDSYSLKQISSKKCALGRWYDGRGKESYSHLAAYRSLGDVHSRYHALINELVDRGVDDMSYKELSTELANIEMLSQQILAFIGRIQHHVELIQNPPQ